MVASAVYFIEPVRSAASAAFKAAHSFVQQWPGFPEGLSLIFLSELGDKTFFIAGLLAMRLGKMVSFVGSCAALSVMTVISVGLGRLFAQVPQFVSSTMPIQQYVGATLLCYFGARQSDCRGMPRGWVLVLRNICTAWVAPVPAMLVLLPEAL